MRVGLAIETVFFLLPILSAGGTELVVGSLEHSSEPLYFRLWAFCCALGLGTSADRFR